jgi:hypothetical protein
MFLSTVVGILMVTLSLISIILGLGHLAVYWCMYFETTRR